MLALDSALMSVGPQGVPERITTLYLDGELSAEELAQLGEELARLLGRGCRTVVMDFGYVTHADYRGVKELGLRAAVFRQGGGRLMVSGLSPYLAAIVRAAGVQTHFDFYSTAESAQRSLGAPPTSA